MSSNALKRGFAVLALTFTGAALLAVGHPQETPEPAAAPAPDRVALLEAKVEQQMAKLSELERTLAGVKSGVAALAAAAVEARAGGFAEAGPNPAARSALLDGIARLDDAVKRATAAPVKKGDGAR